MSFTIHISVFKNSNKALLKYAKENGYLAALTEIQDQFKTISVDSLNRAPLIDVSENITMVAQHIDDPCMGLRVTACLDLDDIAIFLPSKYLKNTQNKNLADEVVSARMLARYFNIMTEEACVHCIIEKSTISFTIKANAKYISHHQTDGSMVGIFRLFTRLTGASLRELYLKQSAPDKNLECYQNIFGIKPTFNAQENKLVFSRSILSSGGDIDYTFFISNYENQFSKVFPDSSFSDNCKQVIKQLLPLGSPTREQMCKIYNMSLSTFKRRLKKDDITYKELVNDVRQSLAHEYIQNGKMSITDATFQLGYSQISEFSKAFKQWYGVSPSK